MDTVVITESDGSAVVVTSLNELMVVTVGEVGPPGPPGIGSLDLSDAPPQMDGVAAPGNDTKASRGDHRHSSDTTKANVADLADVATSGSYADLAGKPALFSGSYPDLTNKPTLFSGSYPDLTNKPTLFSGAYGDLTGKPTLFSGEWADILNKPTFGTVAGLNYPGGTTAFLRADGTWQVPPGGGGGGTGDVVGPAGATTSRIAVFSGTTGKLLADGGYTISQMALLTDLTSLASSLAVVAFSGQYADLLSKPTLFSGAWADLTGKPAFATVATTGAYNDLSGKPALGTLAGLSYPGGTTLYLRADGTWGTPPGGGGSGDVVGPGASVNGRVAIFSGTTGKLIADSGLTLSGTNTGDQTSVTGNAGTATALQTARNIDGIAFNGTADITVIAPATVAATSKGTPVDADVLPIADSAAANVLKKVSWLNVKATLKAYFDTLYTKVFIGLTDAPSTYSGSAGRYVKVNAGATALEFVDGQANTPAGAFQHFMDTAVPTGWVIGNGGTIGSAASGATLRANADTQELFTLWWAKYSDALLPIQTSAGAASTRGASAAADWAANKRLTVFDMQDRVARSVGTIQGNGVALEATQVFDNFGNASAVVTPNTGQSTVNSEGNGSTPVIAYNLTSPTANNTVSLQTSVVRVKSRGMIGCFKLYSSLTAGVPATNPKLPAVYALASPATLDVAFAEDAYKVTALANALSITNPAGAGIDSWAFTIRIKDNGTARALTWGTQYRAIGSALPTTTVAGKTMYVSCVWNNEDVKMDVFPMGVEL